MRQIFRPSKRRLLWIGIALALLPLAVIGWRATDGPRGWTTNHARIEIGAVHPGLEPRSFAATPEQLLDAIRRVTEDSARWALIGHSDDGSRTHLLLERTTRLFRFVDDITLQLTPDAVGTVITGESRSRVGKGDLGQNARNLRQLLDAIERELLATEPAAR